MINIRAGKPVDCATGYVRHTAHIDSQRDIDDIWFMTPVDAHPLSEDWLVPVGVVIGMITGEDVHIEGCISQRLFDSLGEIQRVAAERHAGLKHARVTVDSVGATPRPSAERSLSCFSNGVDAFYTALAEDEQTDELVYVHGFESRPHKDRLPALLFPKLRGAAAEMGLPLRLVETNWRDVMVPLVRFSVFTGIPMLVAMASLMGSKFTRLVIPGTFDPYFDLVDPDSLCSYISLWGTESLDTIEHGHVTRFEKVRHLAESATAMRYLRVCVTNNPIEYNCGRCVKCMRTRVHLKLAGAEGRCATLPARLSLHEIVNSGVEKPEHRNYTEENIVAAESQGQTELAEALRSRLNKDGQRKSWLRNPGAMTWRFLHRIFVRQLYGSYRARRFDASVRKLKRDSGADHWFNWLEVGGPGNN